MKKLCLFTLIVFGFAAMGQAQVVAENALGLRLGDSDGFGAEISYQRGLNDHNRLEFGLGWRDGNDYSAFRFVGLYQWVWNLDGNFNWDGLVLVGGYLTSNGYQTVEGATITGLNELLGETTPASDLGNGNKEFFYDSFRPAAVVRGPPPGHSDGNNQPSATSLRPGRHRRPFLPLVPEVRQPSQEAWAGTPW